MINLSAYDSITNKIDKTKTWINVEKHLLISREIKFHKYYTLAKRFNPELNNYDYFIILLDNKDDSRNYYNTKLDDTKLDNPQITLDEVSDNSYVIIDGILYCFRNASHVVSIRYLFSLIANIANKEKGQNIISQNAKSFSINKGSSSVKFSEIVLYALQR